MRKLWLLVFLLSGFVACKDKLERTKPTIENITEAVYASGIVKSKNQYQVFAPVNGLISKIVVNEGMLVKKGAPLLFINNENAQLNRANAALAATYANPNFNANKLNDLKLSIGLAKSKLLNDSLLYVRQQNLWQQQIGSRVDLEQRELAYLNAKTNYESARLRYNDLLKQTELTAKQTANNLRISEKQENDFVIKSDVDGMVYAILKEEGEMATTQTAIATIGSATEFLLSLQIDEYDIAKIKLGQKVVVRFDSYKKQTFEARVSQINPIMNERSKTFTVEATFITKPPILYPNLTVEANIVLETKQNALTIPRSFLMDDAYVLNSKGDKVMVKTGLMDYNKVEILSGLQVTDEISKPIK